MLIRFFVAFVLIASASSRFAHALPLGDPALFNQVSPEMAPGGVDRTGKNDATAAIQWAENEAAKSCGTVVLTGRYLQDSADITEPNCVSTVGGNGHWPGATFSHSDWTRTQSTLVQNPRYTFRMGNNASVQRLTFQRAGLAPPHSFRDLVELTQSFSGTAIIGGDDSLIRDVMVVGYDTCVYSSWHARFWLEDVRGDCTTGFVLDNAHDVSGMRGGEFFPFLAYGLPWPTAVWNVEEVTDNGHGAVMLTVGAPTVPEATLATGDLINVVQLGGLPELTRSWHVSVRDPTHIVLEGSHYHPGYSNGGTLRFEPLRRTGDGVRVTHSDAASIEDVFELGHDIGFHNGEGSGSTSYINDCTDNDIDTHDPTTIGYLEDGKTSWASWIGGCLISQATAIKLDRSPDSYPAVTSFTGLNSFGPAIPEGFLIFMRAGRASIANVPTSGPEGRIYVGNGIQSLILIGNLWWGHPEIVTDNAATLEKVTIVATSVKLAPSKR